MVDLAGIGSSYLLGNVSAYAATLAGQARTPRTATGSSRPPRQHPLSSQIKNPTFRVGLLIWWSCRILPPGPRDYLISHLQA
jgi:hypothetical protein